MQFRNLGNSEIKSSVVILGSWAIGGWMWGGSEHNQAVDAIHAALDAGINTIDTAPIYGFGKSEEIVGEAIKNCRDKVIIATKCGMIWNQAKGEHFFDSSAVAACKSGQSDSQYHIYKYLAADSIRFEVEQSLRRLKTDYIDLYQTHWQEKTTAIEETMTTLMQLKQEGKIRAIGVSNANTTQIETYRNFGQVDTDQEKYSMLDRKKENEQLKYCQNKKISFLAYSPLALGLLSGKISSETVFGKGDLRAGTQRFSSENIEIVANMLAELAPIAQEQQISVAQLVIAWTFSQPGCSHVLVGARKVHHALENAAAGNVILTATNLQKIDLILNKYPLISGCA